MIRGVDDAGCVVLGLTRVELEQLLKGARICSNPRLPHAPGPHLCIYGAENDEALQTLIADKYPVQGRRTPDADYRGDPTLMTHPQPAVSTDKAGGQ